ncbi:MAG: M90 family metallopeptidase [Acidimicrobiales bacterium]
MAWFHRRRPPPDPDEIEAVINREVVLARNLDADWSERHRAITAVLITSKRWEPVGGLELTTPMIVTIAANAAIPVLALDLWLYRNVGSIIVRPSAARSSGVRAGPTAGVVTDDEISTIGQTMPHSGPLSIAWDAARSDSRNPAAGRNVVIHEFAHKLDMSDGYSDGVPALRGDEADRWVDLLADEYGHAEDRPSDAVLRPYAWTNPAEFFAVASEAFFCTPAALRQAKPALHSALVGFYRQDPELLHR